MNNQTTLSMSEGASGQMSAKRFQGLLDILIVFAPIIGIVILGNVIRTDTMAGGMVVNLGFVVSVIIGAVVLKMRGTSWRKIGLARPKNWPRTILLSFAAMVGTIIVITMSDALIQNLPGFEVEPADLSRFEPMVGDLSVLIFGVTLAWTFITFGEEMLYRAFLINRFGDFFQNTRLGSALAVVLSAVVFGFAHYVEGPAGIAGTAAMGLLFGFIYHKSGRNLWITIIAHGLLNTLRFVALYFGVF